MCIKKLEGRLIFAEELIWFSCGISFRQGVVVWMAYAWPLTDSDFASMKSGSVEASQCSIFIDLRS